MSDPFFFGYGSLVNRRTHDYPEAHPARVTGWRRAWRKSARFDRCLLSAVPATEDYIDGLIAAVPGADWAALDEREGGYARHDASAAVRHPVDRPLDIAIYAVDLEHFPVPGDDDPVLLSYLDVVVQGFHTEFGRAGVDHFFETTENWHVPVLDDRAAPIYPRHQSLIEEETALVDEGLARVGARIVGL
ncbi:MAG: gamma-glutamylcyclotransferase family protein [Maritimibacter harenae]